MSTICLVVVAIFLGLVRVAAAGADEIAYACEYDICTIDPDNPTTHADLTGTPDNDDLQPAWSPDGSAISFTGHYEEGRAHVYVTKPAEPGMATDLFGPIDLQGGKSTWSPDGKEIAFAASTIEEYNTLNIYLSPASGTSPPQDLTTASTGGSEPTWSPDGSEIAYAHGSAIYLVAPEASSTPHALPGGVGTEPAWSPDGTRIAAITTDEPDKVRLIDASGDGGYTTEPERAYSYFRPSWSPDSQEIAYESEGPDAGGDIRIAPTDPVGPGYTIKLPSGVIVPHGPTFSPDGSRVAFSAQDENHGGTDRIYVAAAMPGAEAVAVTPESASMNDLEPAWKPVPVGSSEGKGGSGGGSSETGAGGSAASGGASSSASGGPGTTTREPVVLKFAAFRHPRFSGGDLMGAYVPCSLGSSNAVCHADGEATYDSPITNSLDYARSKAKPTVIARGSVTIPAGRTKPLPLKITGAGKKLLKPGRSLKLTLTVVETAAGARPKTTTRALTLEVPRK